jgi:hypothetical protein
MNRLVLLALVASILGTGCGHDTCDARTVAIGWPSFLLADGTATSSCGVALLSTVDVFVDGSSVGSFNCTDGGVNVTGVLNDGNHVFDVEGIDSATGAIALRDSVTVGNSNCTDLLVNTQPSEGTFVLNYSFTPNICTSATNSYIWFTIHDDIANQDIAVDGSNSPRAYTCGNGSTTPVPISFALPSGSYTLHRTEEVLYPGPTQQAGNCNATLFAMEGATRTQVNVPLTDAVACF